MNLIFRNPRTAFAVAVMVAGMLAGSANAADAGATMVKLSGSQEVPAVETAASGSGKITVGADKSVSGSVTTYGIAGTMAHIHQAAPGHNGSVIIPLQQAAANVWTVPAGAKLTDEQYKSYKAGDLYVNVHSKAHPDGEIRGQLKP